MPEEETARATHTQILRQKTSTYLTEEGTEALRVPEIHRERRSRVAYRLWNDFETLLNTAFKFTDDWLGNLNSKSPLKHTPRPTTMPNH